MKSKFRLMIFGVLATGLVGCAQSGDGLADNATLPVTVLSAPEWCGGNSGPSVRWITHEDDWRNLYGRLNRLRMNPPPPPAVGFPDEGVLLVSLGQKASAGYGLDLAERTARVRDGVLTVWVEPRQPASGYRQAQVVTSPCLLLTLPNAVFTRIEIVDSDGQVWLEGAGR